METYMRQTFLHYSLFTKCSEDKTKLISTKQRLIKVSFGDTKVEGE